VETEMGGTFGGEMEENHADSKGRKCERKNGQAVRSRGGVRLASRVHTCDGRIFSQVEEKKSGGNGKGGEGGAEKFLL